MHQLSEEKGLTIPSTPAIYFKSTPSRPRRITKIHRSQNFLLIWLDGNIDEVKNQHSINTISRLSEIISTIKTFENVDKCVQFISNVEEEQVFLISSGALGQAAIPLVHRMTQVNTIYIFGDSKTPHEQWSKEWIKVHGVFTDIKFLCEALNQAVQNCGQNTIPMSFVAPDAGSNDKKLIELDQSFIYSKILKEILLTIRFRQEHIDEFISYCREQFAGNTKELNDVNKFEREYKKHAPIWWYTSPSFLYSMLNNALEATNVETIINMGFFIRDLHNNIVQLHSEQCPDRDDIITVYRGQGMSRADFVQLEKSKRGLLSFNNFLSTKEDREMSFNSARRTIETTDLVGILFIITIDPSLSSTPFAYTRDGSYYKGEGEILFSIHSVFQIGHINQIDQDGRVWEVNLTLTGDDDPQLYILTDYIQEEIFPDLKGWYRLGSVLIKIGQFDKAQKVFEILLNQTPTDHEEANIYHMLGRTKDKQGLYAESITFYKKSIEIKEKILSPTHADVADSYGEMGLVYYKMGEYLKALSSHEKTVEIRRQSLPPDHPNLATSHNNLGLVYSKMGEYTKALVSFQKAFNIYEKTLPLDHPYLATSHNNIGGVYEQMGEYAKALTFHEKALVIRRKTLPRDHHSLATSHNNLGLVYSKMGERWKALQSHETALEIYQKAVPLNHLHLTTCYNNIGAIYEQMSEYTDALSSHEKALNIKQKILPPNHPSLANSYTNLGLVYDRLGDHTKAFSFHEKALQIYEQKFPPNHPNLAVSYGHIGMLSSKLKEHPKAVSYCERALKIVEDSLPPGHPYHQLFKTNLEHVQKKYNRNIFISLKKKIVK